ncbi:hypothetical protein [Paenimyroides ceti]
MKKNEKKEGSIWFLIVFFVGVGFLIYFQVYKKDKLFYLKEALASNIEQSYAGVIEKKYVDKRNHNSPMIRFTNGESIGINGFFRGKMQVGDSISKVKGDSVIQVFRNGEKIILEIAPFYEKAIEEQQKK